MPDPAANGGSVRPNIRQTVPRVNNMDALRLLFASLVIACHVYPLSLNPALLGLSRWADGTWPVRGFFILSGFLIFQSYENSRTLGSYVDKRLRRIYPAYFMVVVFWAAIGALLTQLPLRAYFTKDLAAYFVNNLVFLNYRHPDLPGVFAHQPVSAVNGALWTIKVEVMFYITVPAIVWLMKWVRRDLLLGAIYVLSAIYFAYFSNLAVKTGNMAYDTFAKQLPGQMSYFISGAALYYHFRFFVEHRKFLALAGLAGMSAGILLQQEWILPASLGSLVIAAAFGPYLGNVGRYGDFSYGIYIWHFPIIEFFVSIGLYAYQPWLGISATVITALTAAFFSWHLVERRFLRRDSHYRAVEKSTG